MVHSLRACIAAFGAACGPDAWPAYLLIAHDADDAADLVRVRVHTQGARSSGEIVLTEEQLRHLALDIIKAIGPTSPGEPKKD